jgi:thiosulfate/3-mercaptopyruvate sulfurtransferase
MKKYPCPEGDAPVRWVDTEWLSAHLNQADLTILDVHSNIHEYIKGHIPGAVYLNEGILRFHGRSLPSEWLPAEATQNILGLYGLSHDKPVVVYTGSPILTGCTTFIGDGLEQPFTAYTLARFGHNNVYILDGGIDKWRAEGRPLSQTFPTHTPSDFRVNIRTDYFIGYNEFRSVKDRSDVTVLDARPPQVYEGQGPWIKPGHIPGAINLPWKSLMTQDNPRKLKSDDEIAAILKEKGVSPDRTVICSCGTGREATNEFLLFKFYLKYPNVRIYEGSFTEWTMYPDNPVVTGKSPR